MTRFWLLVPVALWLSASVAATAADPDVAGRRASRALPAMAPAERAPDVGPNRAGPAPAIERSDRALRRPLRALDVDPNRPLAMVRLEVLVGDMPRKAAKADAAAEKAAAELSPEEIRRQMEVLIEAELTTVENQPAFIQVGRREPRITGAMTTNAGMTNSVTMEATGTTIGFTSRVAADGSVIVEIDLQDSRLGPPEEGKPIAVPAKGEPIRTPNTETFTLQTILSLRDGQPLVASGMIRQPNAEKRGYVIVTAHVLGKGKTEATGR